MTTAGAPTIVEVSAYLDAISGGVTSWSDGDIQQALDAEQGDQAARLKFPIVNDALTYTPALVEALCRRVAHNLAARSFPLGFQATVTDAAALSAYIPGSDAEVRRLEGPYRRMKVG